MPLLCGQPLSSLQNRRVAWTLSVLARRGKIVDIDTAHLRHDPTLRSNDRDLACTVDVRAWSAQALVEIGMHISDGRQPRPGCRFFDGLVAVRPLIRCQIGLGWTPLTVCDHTGPLAELWRSLRLPVADALEQTGHSTDSVLAYALRAHAAGRTTDRGQMRHLHPVASPPASATVINLAAARRRHRRPSGRTPARPA